MNALKEALKKLLMDIIKELLIDPDVPIIPAVIEGPMDEALLKGVEKVLDKLLG